VARLLTLQKSLRKVALNVAKFPYSESLYRKHLEQLANGQTSGKMKIVEEV